MGHEYGSWYLAILVGTKKVSVKGTRGKHFAQQLIIKEWRYGTEKEAWESAAETSRVELLSGDEYVTDIRIETMRCLPESNGEFTTLYNAYKPMVSKYLDKTIDQLTTQEQFKRQIEFDDVASLGRAAAFVTQFLLANNAATNMENIRKSRPGIQFWVNDLDLKAMMKACVADELFLRLGFGWHKVQTEEMAMGAV